MANTITNILTINGTEEQVSNVRNFIKGANGESISLQSIYPMPEEIDDESEVEFMGLSFEAWHFWRMVNWDTSWEARPVHDEHVDTPNRIMFDTGSTTPVNAMMHLSNAFPEIPFNVVFSDEYPGQYSGEYTLVGGEVTNRVWRDTMDWSRNNCTESESMEYYFLTHEYDRENWKRDDNGEWICMETEE